MAFRKFSKGKSIYSVPNGIGDGSAFFDGNSSKARIESGLDVLPSGSTSGSISVWFYQKSGTNLRGIVGYGVFSATRQDRFIMTNFPYIYSCGYNDDYTYDSKSIEYNKWYHVVMVYENATEKCYLNGELIGERSFNFNTTPARIDIGWHDNSRYFNGNIANILFYNRALTATEVETLYNKGTVEDGLVLNVPLQYGKDNDSMFSSKSFVYDYSIVETSSGFNDWGYPIRYRQASEAGVNYSVLPNDDMWCHITFDDGTMISKCGSYHLSDNHGTYAEEYIDGVKKGKAVKFYRLDSNIPWGKIVNDTDFTICFWLKVPILPNWVKNGGGHWDLYGGSVWANTACITNSDRKPRVQIWASQDDNNYSNPIDSLASTVEYPINEWFHFCYVKKGNEIFYFQNGKLVGQKTLSFTIKEYRVPNNTLKFGYQSDYNNYTLCIDDFRIYNKAVFTKDFIV